MPYTAVIFDLFGTIVPPFRRSEHGEAIRVCADVLGIPFEDCHHHWVTSFPERVRGRFASVAENFEWIANHCGCRIDSDLAWHAEAHYDEFTLGGLLPLPETIETLLWLKERGVKLGLVTNCAPDVPRLWSRTEFATIFNFCSYSCLTGFVKPDADIYQDALVGLDVEPKRVLYVGDGSDEELSGARAVGMEPVLVRRDLSNTYDSFRKDVDQWDGKVIRSIDELRPFFLDKT